MTKFTDKYNKLMEIVNKNDPDVVDDENLDIKECDDGDYWAEMDNEFNDDELIDEDDNYLTEVTAKKKKVVRDGKRQTLWVCPTGYKKDGKTCKKMSASESTKLSRQAKKSAKKAKSKRAASARKRARSIAKRQN